MAETMPRSPRRVRIQRVVELTYDVCAFILAAFLVATYRGPWFAHPFVTAFLVITAVGVFAFPIRFVQKDVVVTHDASGAIVIASVLLLPRPEALLVVAAGILGSLRLDRQPIYRFLVAGDVTMATCVMLLCMTRPLIHPNMHFVVLTLVLSLVAVLVRGTLMMYWLIDNQGLTFKSAFKGQGTGWLTNFGVELLITLVLAALLLALPVAAIAFVLLSAIAMLMLKRALAVESDRNKLHLLFDFASHKPTGEVTARSLADEVLQVAKQALPSEAIELQTNQPGECVTNVFLWDVDGAPTWLVHEFASDQGDQVYVSGGLGSLVHEYFTVLAETAGRVLENTLLQEKLRNAALHNELTGLPNRRLFDDHLQQAVAQAKRENSNVTVLFIDLNGFKDINDTYGHDAGDQLLVAVADRFRNAIRENDVIARFGGDEFCVLVRSPNSPAKVDELVERLSHCSKEAFRLAGHEFSVSGSIGVASLPECADSAVALLKAADTAMYLAKAKGVGVVWAPKSAQTTMTA